MLKMKAANADEKNANDFQERTIIIIIFIQEAPLTEVFFREVLISNQRLGR
jgi:hypothetical protein